MSENHTITVDLQPTEKEIAYTDIPVKVADLEKFGGPPESKVFTISENVSMAKLLKLATPPS